MASAGPPPMPISKPALKRGNVKLITRAFAHRVLLEGKRAVGVESTSAASCSR